MSVLFGRLAALWSRLGARPYDAMYRRGAPWDTGPREELAALLDSDQLTRSIGPRALDIGCGSGADPRLLAGHGFEVVGVDFSEVARPGPGRRRRAALRAGRPLRPPSGGDRRALRPDLRRRHDRRPVRAGQQEAAWLVTSLARPGSVLVMWCFSAHREDAPWFSLNGPSRLGGMGITPEQVDALYSAHWDIEDLPTAIPANARPSTG